MTHVHAVWFWSLDRCVVFCRNRHSTRWRSRRRPPRRSRSVCRPSSRRRYRRSSAASAGHVLTQRRKDPSDDDASSVGVFAADAWKIQNIFTEYCFLNRVKMLLFFIVAFKYSLPFCSDLFCMHNCIILNICIEQKSFFRFIEIKFMELVLLKLTNCI